VPPIKPSQSLLNDPPFFCHANPSATSRVERPLCLRLGALLCSWAPLPLLPEIILPRPICSFLAKPALLVTCSRDFYSFFALTLIPTCRIALIDPYATGTRPLPPGRDSLGRTSFPSRCRLRSRTAYRVPLDVCCFLLLFCFV